MKLQRRSKLQRRFMHMALKSKSRQRSDPGITIVTTSNDKRIPVSTIADTVSKDGIAVMLAAAKHTTVMATGIIVITVTPVTGPIVGKDMATGLIEALHHPIDTGLSVRSVWPNGISTLPV